MAGRVFVVTTCNFTAPIATSGALSNPLEVLLHPDSRVGIWPLVESLPAHAGWRICLLLSDLAKQWAMECSQFAGKQSQNSTMNNCVP